MRLLARGAAIIIFSLLATSASADDDPAFDRFFLMPNLSTLGAGLEAGYRFDDRWRVRAGISGLSGRFTYHDRDSDLRSRVSLFSGGLTVDYSPFATGAYISGGVRLSGNRIEGKVKNLHGKLRNGSRVFVPDPLTDYTVTQNAVQPYMGAGYSVKIKKSVSIDFSLGALYAGKPDLDVDSRAHKLGFSRRDIRREIDHAANRIAPFQVYPVVQVGLKFEF